MRWWPLLLIFAVTGLVYLVRPSSDEHPLGKVPQEQLAIAVCALTTVFAITRVIRRTDRLNSVILLITLSVLCREIHWGWTDPAINIAVPVILVLCVLIRGDWSQAFRTRPSCQVWMISAFVAYAFSQLVARRVFSGVLPLEAVIQDPLEEMSENLAHLMLLVGVLLVPVACPPEGITGKRTLARGTQRPEPSAESDSRRDPPPGSSSPPGGDPPRGARGS